MFSKKVQLFEAGSYPDSLQRTWVFSVEELETIAENTHDRIQTGFSIPVLLNGDKSLENIIGIAHSFFVEESRLIGIIDFFKKNDISNETHSITPALILNEGVVECVYSIAVMDKVRTIAAPTIAFSRIFYPNWIGDRACSFNALSRYLQCAVNPTGNCEDCQYHSNRN